jgi:uncharacterized membrane protein YgdD (TMEM256/DUF423 family)
MLSQKQILLLASALGILAVSIGAFGAHALKALLAENNRLDTYELAVRYHFYHTLALLGTGILMNNFKSTGLQVSAWFFLTGILLFSGSLYALSLLNITKIAIITPIGGVFLIAGWTALFISILKSNKNQS